jgi:hypothetical protein
MIERWSSESFRTRCMRRSKLATRNHASRVLKQTLPSSMCTKKGLGSRANDCLDSRSAASKSGFRRRSLRRHPHRHWGQDCAQAHVPRRTNKFPEAGARSSVTKGRTVPENVVSIFDCGFDFGLRLVKLLKAVLLGHQRRSQRPQSIVALHSCINLAWRDEKNHSHILAPPHQRLPSNRSIRLDPPISVHCARSSRGATMIMH